MIEHVEASERHVGKSVCTFGVAGASHPFTGKEASKRGYLPDRRRCRRAEKGLGGLFLSLFISNEEEVDGECFRKKRESR